MGNPNPIQRRGVRPPTTNLNHAPAGPRGKEHEQASPADPGRPRTPVFCSPSSGTSLNTTIRHAGGTP
ncbi:hypothetical protein SGR_163 [Streptomyces griseus subsp. griseus NBRC 13350]|uniref:Uncharacterized protein n=1 Tax=Streptomyces griseus subsp. griseus (strain JCM 4626 / CBS 651.72 / NBRC 13350 / KCC S-0626 / ISP 5235) TaxID=455632 RepID=B1VNG9_STRGG|nr:hypothetical protein SGR_163 [Streptomyces griseus subsp. griseus NBRC 13350]